MKTQFNVAKKNIAFIIKKIVAAINKTLEFKDCNKNTSFYIQYEKSYFSPYIEHYNILCSKWLAKNYL